VPARGRRPLRRQHREVLLEVARPIAARTIRRVSAASGIDTCIRSLRPDLRERRKHQRLHLAPIGEPPDPVDLADYRLRRKVILGGLISEYQIAA
jgi:hypothetical protein